MANRNPHEVRRGGNSPVLRPHLECLEDRSVPATFVVTTTLDVVDPADGKRSLREAITAANTTPTPDTIALPAGVFRVALAGAGEDGNATGDFDITSPVTIRGAGAGKTIIDGRQLDRVLDVRGTPTRTIAVVLEGLEVRNGEVAGDGGGVRVADANLTVRDAVVAGNRATGNGGGVSADGESGAGGVTLVRTTVTYNAASRNGGGIFADRVALTGSTVVRNAAEGDGSGVFGNGGGIYADTVTAANTRVIRNAAERDGGGMYADRVTMTDGTLVGNLARSDGSGIYGGTVRLTRCTVGGNIGEDSVPGITPYRSLTLISCTLRANLRTQPPTFVVTTALDVVNPADGRLSLREAITAANAAPGPDTIALPAGVFRLARPGANEDANASGDLDVTGTLTLRGAGATRTVLDGRRLDRVLDVRGTPTSTVRVSLVGLEVRNGEVAGDGGGVRVADAGLSVRGAVVAGNRASGNGGGLFYATPSRILFFSLDRATVAGNAAGGNGGGIHSSTEGTSVGVVASTVRGNSAGADGGGVYADSAFLNDSTVSGNTARGGGGGVYADFTGLSGSTVSGNSAGADGGGVRALNVRADDSTVSGNSAGARGGGIYARFGTLRRGTVVRNTAQTGGGVFHDLLRAGLTFDVRSTIIALNQVGPGGTGPDVAGDPFTSDGHNLIGVNGSTGFTNGVNGDIVGTSAAPIDPKIGDLTNNGGPTPTHALLAGSPAIDAGDNEFGPATDQRGVGFPREKDGNGDGTAAADIGAFEV